MGAIMHKLIIDDNENFNSSFKMIINENMLSNDFISTIYFSRSKAQIAFHFIMRFVLGTIPKIDKHLE